ncbi:MAG: DUF2092 domain-containing protein [Parvibaculaceae bacterium]
MISLSSCAFRKYLTAGAFLAGLLPAGSAWADDARELLKAMSDYLAKQQSFSFSYQSTLEAVTDGFQKLQFVSSGTATVSRPDKIHITRTGGFADLDVVFDGTTLSVFGKHVNAYTQIEAKGTLDELIDRLADAGVNAPGGDLLASNVFDGLIDNVTDAKHIASAFVDGVECEYLAFRTPETDWQIWIEAGEHPIPRRYVITSKHIVMAPQYTLEISNFKSEPKVADATFKFEKPASAKQVDLSELGMIDELPTAANAGGAQ